MTPQKPITLGIGVPSLGFWHDDMGAALVRLTAHLMSAPPTRPFNLHLSTRRTSILLQSRAGIVRDCMAHGCTHILWIDADMHFPWDAASRLLAHGKSVIGANYPQKRDPFTPTTVGLDGAPVYSANKEGIERVAHLGMGLLLTDMDCFRLLPQPWFAMPWWPDGDTYIGEDRALCQMLREKGVAIWCDHDLSNDTQHMGPFAFTNDLSEQARADHAGKANGAHDLQRTVAGD